MKLKANATAKDAMSGEMVEQTHAMCLQQTNQTMMTMMTKTTMNDDERDARNGADADELHEHDC